MSVHRPRTNCADWWWASRAVYSRRILARRRDLPDRLEKYGGDHVLLYRIAIDEDDLLNLQTFPASDKAKDPRYSWFVQNYGNQCCELDAMDPSLLRARVEAAIRDDIEPDAWARCEAINKAETESLRTVLDAWTERQNGSVAQNGLGDIEARVAIGLQFTVCCHRVAG